MRRFRFKEYVFTDEIFSKYYIKYKGHEFVIVGVPFAGHCEIRCVTDPSIIVPGVVHFCDLLEV